MSTERRPARPTTRVGSSVRPATSIRPAPAPAPAPAKAPTGRVPAAAPKPQTSRVPAAAPPPPPAPKPATSRVAGASAPQKKGTAKITRTGTRVMRPDGHGAPRAAAPAPKKNNALLIGGIAGGVLLLVIAGVALSGGESKKHSEPSPASKKETSRPVDVRGLEAEGMSKCNEGLRIIKNNEALMSSASLNGGDRARLKGELEKAHELIKEGMGMLDEANKKSGNQYDVSAFIQAKKAARMKLGELGN